VRLFSFRKTGHLLFQVFYISFFQIHNKRRPCVRIVFPFAQRTFFKLT
jgi:hypothetical protein